MTPQELKAIRERCEAAYPGPWEQGPPHNADRVFSANGRNICGGMCMDGDAENHAFIAHARQDIPALLAEVARLQAALTHRELQRNEAVGIIKAIRDRAIDKSATMATLSYARDWMEREGLS